MPNPWWPPQETSNAPTDQANRRGASHTGRPSRQPKSPPYQNQPHFIANRKYCSRLYGLKLVHYRMLQQFEPLLSSLTIGARAFSSPMRLGSPAIRFGLEPTPKPPDDTMANPGRLVGFGNLGTMAFR